MGSAQGWVDANGAHHAAVNVLHYMTMKRKCAHKSRVAQIYPTPGNQRRRHKISSSQRIVRPPTTSDAYEPQSNFRIVFRRILGVLVQADSSLTFGMQCYLRFWKHSLQRGTIFHNSRIQKRRLRPHHSILRWFDLLDLDFQPQSIAEDLTKQTMLW
jgi:hypothetical protein